jgi:tRNA threonylcarbamoyladenosine biosynthesis protein TsaE
LDLDRRSLLHGAQETIAFGERLGRLLQPGDWVALTGDLGAGKTTLVQGIVEGIHPGQKSRSPTYVRVEVYGSRPAIVHADLYRLETAGEWDTLGIEDLARAEGGAVVVVEWADRAPGRLPEDRVLVSLRYAGPDAREARIEARGERWQGLVAGELEREG